MSNIFDITAKTYITYYNGNYGGYYNAGNYTYASNNNTNSKSPKEPVSKNERNTNEELSLFNPANYEITDEYGPYLDNPRLVPDYHVYISIICPECGAITHYYPDFEKDNVANVCEFCQEVIILGDDDGLDDDKDISKLY